MYLSPCEEVVDADGGVEDVARGDTGRIVVVILGVGSGDGEEAGGELRGEALRWVCPERGGFDAVAGEAGLELLVGVRPLRSTPGWPLMEMDVAAQRVFGPMTL